MGNERQPVGWVPLEPIPLIANSGLTKIPFDGAGYRTVKLAILSKGANDVHGNASEDDVGQTAVVAATGATEPTVVTLSVDSLPYYLYAAVPTESLVQPFGLVGGEQLLLSI